MGNYSGKKVLVTGGCGFVGSNLVHRLDKEGAEIYILDDLFTGSLDNVKDVVCSVFVDSVNNATMVDQLVIESDIIFHLAARNIIASTKDPVEDYKVNIGGTLNILMSMKNDWKKKLVYTSSASVYGNSRYLPINEDDCINLLTPYAVSKYAGEGYCMAFHESYGIPVTVLRLSNVYGPWQSPMNPYCGVVAKFLERSNKDMEVYIHGDGLSTRDFTYIDDVVDALLIAGLSPKADGEIFNVATGIETSISKLAELIVTPLMGLGYITDLDVKRKRELITYVDRRDIDNIRRRVLNIEKIRRKLGWTPTVTLEKGLQLTRKWMETNGTHS